MKTIELKVKTKDGEKVYSADDIPFGALEECIKIENMSELEALNAFPKIIKMTFPEITDEEIKQLGMRRVMQFITQDIKELMQPINEAVKN